MRRANASIWPLTRALPRSPGASHSGTRPDVLDVLFPSFLEISRYMTTMSSRSDTAPLSPKASLANLLTSYEDLIYDFADLRCNSRGIERYGLTFNLDGPTFEAMQMSLNQAYWDANTEFMKLRRRMLT